MSAGTRTPNLLVRLTDDNRSSSARPDRKWSVETPAESGQDTPSRRAAGQPPAAHTRGTAIEIEPDPTSPVQTRTPTRCESFARPQPTSGFRLPRQDPRFLETLGAAWRQSGGSRELCAKAPGRVYNVSISRTHHEDQDPPPEPALAQESAEPQRYRATTEPEPHLSPFEGDTGGHTPPRNVVSSMTSASDVTERPP